MRIYNYLTYYSSLNTHFCDLTHLFNHHQWVKLIFKMKEKNRHKYHQILICICILSIFLFLLGCGGGGSGSGGTGSVLVPNSQDQDQDYNYNDDNPSRYLVWDPPTTNADGTTPLTDLAGYKVYFGTESHSYTSNVNVGNTTTVAINSLGITSGTWCFAVTAYDTSGNESDYSNEVCADI